MSLKINEVLTSTSLTLGMGGIKIPCSITLKSTEVGRKIELSTNEVDYFEPTLTISDTNFIVVDVSAPISNIKVTGAADDVLTIIDSEVF